MTLTPTQTQQILDWCDKHGVEKPICVEDGLANDVVWIDDLLNWLHVVLGDKENPKYIREQRLKENTADSEGLCYECSREYNHEPTTLHEALYRSAYAVEYGKKSVDDWFGEVVEVLESLK